MFLFSDAKKRVNASMKLKEEKKADPMNLININHTVIVTENNWCLYTDKCKGYNRKINYRDQSLNLENMLQNNDKVLNNY